MTKLSGGANIGGWTAASAPLASLIVEKDALTLRILLIGTYCFAKNQVVRFAEDRFLFSRGIKIEHTVAEYPEKITFWCSTPVEDALRSIQKEGFVPEGKAPEIREPRGVPFRWLTVLLLFLYWNVPYVLKAGGWISPSRPFTPFSWYFVGVHVGFVLLMSCIRWVEPCRPFLLKPGRSIEEVKHWVNLCIVGFSFGAMLLSIVLLLGYQPR